MFAVTGWSVSADALKAQVAAPRPANASSKRARKNKSKNKNKNGEGLGTGANASVLKKRKWGADVDPKSVTAETLEQSVPSKEDGKLAFKDNGVDTSKRERKRHKKSKQADEQQKTEPKSVDNLPSPDINADVEPQHPSDSSKIKSLSRAEKKALRKQKKLETQLAPGSVVKPDTSLRSLPQPQPAPTLTPLQAKMQEKLLGARFRYLNETLYTSPSTHSLSLFGAHPEMYEEYHTGFRKQVESWPENPVDRLILEIKTRGKIRGRSRNEAAESASQTSALPLPRSGPPSYVCTIADLGCGDAKLSRVLSPLSKKLHLSIRSFDIGAPSVPSPSSSHPVVERADIANLSLASGSVDVAIFCLALMGTNWPAFIDEAYRILRWKGELWIAEIKSRFQPLSSTQQQHQRVAHSVGNRRKVPSASVKSSTSTSTTREEQEILEETVDGVERRNETDVTGFIEVLRRRGLLLQKDDKNAIDMSNKMFVRMVFVKAAPPVKGKNASAGTVADIGEDDEVEAKVLKPCLYKVR